MSSVAKPRLFPILLVNFIGALGFSILLPFLIFLVKDFGGNGLVYGLIGATYSAFQFIGAPILGRWSDKIGRRPVLLVSQLGTLGAWGIFLVAIFLPKTPLAAFGEVALTIPLLLLFVARVLDGLTGGNISVANAYLADVSTEKTRQANFGKMGMAASLGFMLGPAIGGLLGGTSLGYSLPVAAALAISAVASFVIGFGLPEPPKETDEVPPPETGLRKTLGHEHRECHDHSHEHHLSLGDLHRRPALRLLLALNFIIFLAMNLFYVGFPVHAGAALEWTATDLGWFFAVMSTMSLVAQGPLLGSLSKRVSTRTLFAVGCGVLALAFVLMLTGFTAAVYAAAALFAVGNGLSWPSFQAMLSESVDPKEQGTVQGWSTSAGSLASIIGLVAGGVAYGFVGSLLFAAVAALFALVACVGTALAARAHRQREALPHGSIDKVGGDDEGKFLIPDADALDREPLAHLDWEVFERKLVILDTQVQPPLRGRGAGGRLMRAAVELARERGLQILPTCAYAQHWMESKPELADLLAHLPTD